MELARDGVHITAMILDKTLIKPDESGFIQYTVPYVVGESVSTSRGNTMQKAVQRLLDDYGVKESDLLSLPLG